MKPASLLCVVTVFILMLSSCQKELDDTVAGSDSTVVDPNAFLVKRYVEDLYATADPNQHVKDSFTLSYDDKGRQLSMVSTNPADGLKFIYAYSDHSFTLNQYQGNTLGLHEVFYLNNLSFIDSTFQDDQEGDTTTEKYIYNGYNQLAQVNEYSYTSAGGSVLESTTENTYDINGNLSSTKDDDTITTYDFTKKIINNLNMGLNYFQPSKYLPNSFTNIIGADRVTGTHTYTFDDKGRLTEDKTDLSNGYVAIKKYYY